MSGRMRSISVSSRAAAPGDQVVAAAARSLSTTPPERTSSFDTSCRWTSTPAAHSPSTSRSTETFSPDGVAAE